MTIGSDLKKAIENGAIHKIKGFTWQQLTIQYPEIDNYHALGFACWKGSFATIKAVLDKLGYQVSVEASFDAGSGWTPLHLVCRYQNSYQNTEAVKLIVQA